MNQQIRFCTAADGVRIAYASVGQGPAVIYVSGAPTHLEREWEQSAIRDFLSRLARRCTLVRYDMRGSGLSDRSVDDFSVEALSADLRAVVAQVGQIPIRLLSLGALAGPIALLFAAGNPDVVERLAIYGGFARGADLMGETERRRLIDYIRDFGFPHFSFTDAEGLSLETHRGVDEVINAAAEPGVVAAIFETYFSVDVTEALDHVRVPALVLHGTDHRMVPFECGRRLAAALPDALFQPLAGGTSSPFSVADELVPTVERFFGFAASRTPAHSSLTSREIEVLTLLAQGMSNAEIAGALYISEKTVKSHIGHILAKLGARHRTEAVIIATRDGVLGS